MCQDLNKKVSTIVNDWITKGYMFSAFDVTKTLRNIGESVAHWEVRNEVRDQYGTGNMGSYMRTLITVGSNPSETFIYHQYTSDPNTYDSDWQNSDPTQDKNKVKTSGSGVTAASITTSTPVASIKHNDDKVHLTKENRLNISSDLIDSMGLVNGDIVAVEGIIVNGIPMAEIKLFQPSYTYVAQYIVDNDSRIRLSSKTLKKVFGNVGSTYSVIYNVASNSVTVEPA